MIILNKGTGKSWYLSSFKCFSHMLRPAKINYKLFILSPDIKKQHVKAYKNGKTKSE
jgi:hypothetical protein